MVLSPDMEQALAAHAKEADEAAQWPEASWEVLRRTGILGGCIPRAYEGKELGELELLESYEQLARACLTTCFLLSQRESACRRLRDSGHDLLCQALLPPLARGETFATVGLSQLTTSRQHMQPVLSARLTTNALLLDGYIPWVTGAARADHIVLGAVLDDGRQVLAVLPRNQEGVTVGEPLDLMALRGSMTAEIHCRNVVLERKWLLAGPEEQVLSQRGRNSTGGLETTCLALGLTAATVAYLQQESVHRPDLQPRVVRLDAARLRLREEMYTLAKHGGTPDKAALLRAHANALVLRATQTALTASKGSGFLRQHPAQRWARQALFFLVWSCPQPAAEATLECLESILLPE